MDDDVQLQVVLYWSDGGWMMEGQYNAQRDGMRGEPCDLRLLASVGLPTIELLVELCSEQVPYRIVDAPSDDVQREPNSARYWRRNSIDGLSATVCYMDVPEPEHVDELLALLRRECAVKARHVRRFSRVRPRGLARAPQIDGQAYRQRSLQRLREMHRLKSRCALAKPEWSCSLSELLARDRYYSLRVQQVRDDHTAGIG